LSALDLPTSRWSDYPNSWKGALKHIGGSQSDNWNSRIANDTVLALWVAKAEYKIRDGK
jgi:hypothetical protein